MHHNVIPVHTSTTKRYPFPPKPEEDEIDDDDDDERDEPDDDDDFFGLFTTERNDVMEETTSVSPVLTSTETVTQSRILKALTEKNPQENVVGNVITPLPTAIVAVTPLPTEAVLQNVITVQPVSNIATQVSPVLPSVPPVLQPPSDPVAGAVKEKGEEEEDKMNMDVFPTHIVNNTIEDFHDRDDLTE